jgi:PBSX family phage portal protein
MLGGLQVKEALVSEDVAAKPLPRFRLVEAKKDAFDGSFLSPQGIDPTFRSPQPDNSRAISSNVMDPEDEFQSVYIGGTNARGIIAPPYGLRTLDRLAQTNNALSPCVEAMVTNIEGTGYTFEPEHDDKIDDIEQTKIDEQIQFFAEAWPGTSFVHIRQEVRRDLERTGNGYMEIIRNARDDVVFMRHADSKMMRIVRLDEPVVAEKTVMRKGVEVTIRTKVRERRFVQMLNGRTIIWFKEFGSNRDLDKYTGVWADPGVRLPANRRATEIMHFIALPDAYTPYGVPRWIMQLPSVLGSRKAEEFNLDFFDNGGVPPILILLQGGVLTSETRKALEQGLYQGARRANRVQIVEAEPSGGAIDSASNARMTVERFGHERQNDSMFEKYDDKCEVRIRRCFRLPPIFVGSALDYSFATAYASYTCAEAQVFKPERAAFDTRISMQLITAMGYRGYSMRSHAMHINDATSQLNGITLANRTNRLAPEDLIEGVNDVCGLHLKVSEDPVLPWLVPGTDPNTGLPLRSAENASQVQPPTAVTSPASPPSHTLVQKPPTGSQQGSKPPSNGTPRQTPRGGKPKPKVTASRKQDEVEETATAPAAGSFEDERDVPENSGDDPGDTTE